MLYQVKSEGTGRHVLGPGDSNVILHPADSASSGPDPNGPPHGSREPASLPLSAPGLYSWKEAEWGLKESQEEVNTPHHVSSQGMGVAFSNLGWQSRVVFNAWISWDTLLAHTPTLPALDWHRRLLGREDSVC